MALVVPVNSKRRNSDPLLLIYRG